MRQLSRTCAFRLTSRFNFNARLTSGARAMSGIVWGLSCLLALTACGGGMQQHVLYDSAGIRVGIQSDLSTDDQAAPPRINRHPAEVTPQDMRTLLGALEVSGGSGATTGLLSTPTPQPVFTEGERSILAGPLAAAFHQATPRDRVFFNIENPAAAYESDRTSGTLFFRDDYLHVILTDHYAFMPADTGGGERRDPRDTKNMTLYLRGPARAAALPVEKTPRWTAFEKVHLSFNPETVLAASRIPQASKGSAHPPISQPTEGRTSVPTDNTTSTATESANDLRLEIRELTTSNLELRDRLENQKTQMEQLTRHLEQLRRELETLKAKESPSRKVPAQ